ncbi:MAG: GNAT family N-acetyltransferase [Gammaproteobacteria bacterium]
MITIERHSTQDSLIRLRAVWDELLQRCPERNLFLSHEWACTWWQHFGHAASLWLLTLKCANELVAIAPLCVRRETYGGLPVRVLRFWNNKHTSRAAFIVADRHEEVCDALAGYWRTHAREWDVLRLDDVPVRGSLLPAVERALTAHGLSSFGIGPSKTLFNLPVTGDWQSTLDHWPRKLRKDIRQSAQRLARAGEVQAIVEHDPARIESAMDELFRIQAAHPDAAREQDCAPTAIDRAFQIALTHRLCERGHGYSNHFLRIDNATCAALHTLIYDKTCYGFLTYYDARYAACAPGRYLMTRLLQWCFEQADIRTMDFNGASRFLADWTPREEPLEYLSACHHRPYSRFVAGLKRLKRRLERMRRPADRRVDNPGRASYYGKKPAP